MRRHGSGMLLVLVACSDPARIPEDVCGNAVLEAGEDCDSFPDPALGDGLQCAECRYVCSASVSCPDGWGCDGDGLCQRAGGTFEFATSIAQQAYDLHVDDVDGDGRPDLFGLSPVRFWVRINGPDFRFTDGPETGGVIKPPAYRDVNGDGRVDVVRSTPQSFLVLGGSPSGTLEPIAQSAFDATLEGGLSSTSVRTDASLPFQDFLAIGSAGGVVALQITDGAVRMTTPVFVTGASSLADVRGMAVADTDGAGGEEVAVAVAGQAQVQLFTSGRNGDGSPRLDAAGTIALPGPVPADTGIAFVDLDGDGAVDLLAAVAEGLAVLAGDGDGNFAAATVDPAFATLGWPLCFGDFDGDGRADYVLADGVYRNQPGEPAKLLPSPPIADFAAAVIDDFNRDGIADLAASLDGVPRLYLAMAGPGGLYSYPTLETEGPAFQLQAGDFDGDGVHDVALAERSPLGDRVSVYFGGTAGPFADPVLIARLEHIEGMHAAVMSVPQLLDDDNTDLIVRSTATGSAGETVGMSLHFGAPNRQMVSAFALGADVHDLLVGRFSPGGDDDADVFAVTVPSAAPMADGRSFQLIHGRGTAHFHGSDRRYLSVAPVDDGNFDAGCALWAAADLDGDQRDEVVGLAGCGEPALLQLSLTGSDDAPGTDATTVPLPGLGAPLHLSVDDVDGDGAPDLLVVTDEAISVYWNQDGGFDGARVSLLPGSGWLGAAVLEADGDPGRELVVS
ncbi:MAG TPA: VCBS repeat-containing protein, partial [Kofleriaceae bacterium]|nr:VCBS repeat-containing protein [Kofleriaceae bacterium]